MRNDQDISKQFSFLDRFLTLWIFLAIIFLRGYPEKYFPHAVETPTGVC